MGEKPLKYCYVDQFFLHFWGLLQQCSLSDPGQIWNETVHTWSRLTRQISCECVHCVGFRDQKATIFWQILTFGGLLYRPPFTDEGQIWCARVNPRSILIAYTPSFVSTGIFYHRLAANPQNYHLINLDILWCR